MGASVSVASTNPNYGENDSSFFNCIVFKSAINTISLTFTVRSNFINVTTSEGFRHHDTPATYFCLLYTSPSPRD